MVILVKGTISLSETKQTCIIATSYWTSPHTFICKCHRSCNVKKCPDLKPSLRNKSSSQVTCTDRPILCLKFCLVRFVVNVRFKLNFLWSLCMHACLTAVASCYAHFVEWKRPRIRPTCMRYTHSTRAQRPMIFQIAAAKSIFRQRYPAIRCISIGWMTQK